MLSLRHLAIKTVLPLLASLLCLPAMAQEASAPADAEPASVSPESEEGEAPSEAAVADSEAEEELAEANQEALEEQAEKAEEVAEEQAEKAEEVAEEQAEKAEEMAEEQAEKKAEEEAENKEDSPKTLMGDQQKEKISVGGYGGPSVFGTSFNGQGAVLAGIEGGVLLDRTLVLGGAGYGLVSRVTGPDFRSGNESNLALGYGGMMMRLQGGRGPLYGSIGVLTGAGAMTLLERVEEYEWDYDDENPHGTIFFVVEPSLQLHVNFTRWMRASLHGSYRFVHGVQNYGMDDSDIRGVNLGGNVQFGWF